MLHESLPKNHNPYLAMKHGLDVDISNVVARNAKRSNYYCPVYSSDPVNAIFEECPKVRCKNNGFLILIGIDSSTSFRTKYL